MEFETYTHKTLTKIAGTDARRKPIGCWSEGKFYRGWADGSKTRMGVKYNRLARLYARLLRDQHQQQQQSDLANPDQNKTRNQI